MIPRERARNLLLTAGLRGTFRLSGAPASFEITAILPGFEQRIRALLEREGYEVAERDGVLLVTWREG